MEQTTQQTGDANIATNNPQNVGGQNITAPTTSLQSPVTGQLNNSNLRLTDQNGRALSVSNTSTTQTAVIKPPTTSRHNFTIIGICALIIIGLFVATWLTTRQSTKK